MATATFPARKEVRRVPLAQMSDGELVAAHLEGHPGAFSQLYDRYRDRLVHFIARKTGDRDRAEDLVQEVRGFRRFTGSGGAVQRPEA